MVNTLQVYQEVFLIVGVCLLPTRHLEHELCTQDYTPPLNVKNLVGPLYEVPTVIFHAVHVQVVGVAITITRELCPIHAALAFVALLAQPEIIQILDHTVEKVVDIFTLWK